MERMKISMVGGLGMMLSPAAEHLEDSAQAQVVKVHDRGSAGAQRDERRQAWERYGAVLTDDWDDLLTTGGEPVDGVVVCAGKNADDAKIIRELLPRLAGHPGSGAGDRAGRPFILHLSTVSAGFARAAADVCEERGLAYANYPLTGGPAGAQAATMLILAGGDHAVYERLEPVLEELGRPRYFGQSVVAGAEVKLIGHFMVFNGLNGICSAAALQQQCLPEADSTDFFDFLNNGAGGTRQWDVALRKGLAEGHWDSGFFCKHAAIDCLYAVQLAHEKGLPLPVTLPMLQSALLFGRALRLEDNPVTHSIYSQFKAGSREETDQFLRENLEGLDPETLLQRALDLLPDDVRSSAGLEIRDRQSFA